MDAADLAPGPYSRLGHTRGLELEGDHDDEQQDYQIEEYELVSSPNDFNVSTIFNFIESGAVTIPGFQRNYVWDIKRASKLIESIILGLPVPQIFLYEEGRNHFLVIDGQQRLMSIYYFVKMRFPRIEKRSELRRIIAERGRFDESLLQDNRYFSKFDLSLPNLPSGRPNRFSGLSYDSLGDSRFSFDLRTIRNVVVRQTSPKDDDSSIHEIFNRLNTGGVNLTPQEIRASLYHSAFYDMLSRINVDDAWRSFLGLAEPDLHMKDIEALLRSFALLSENRDYRSPMVRFLDRYSKSAKSFTTDIVIYYEELFRSFIDATSALPRDVFQGESNRFNISLFEATFTAVCEDALRQGVLVAEQLNPSAVSALSEDEQFLVASQVGTTNSGNVQTRLTRARALLKPALAAQLEGE
jgi:uncharacterized protein with ParB-like and HNH nuclease domain